MNAREWLEQATKEMPEAVRDRVSVETFAHLEDAGMGEGADVRAVLGDPGKMRRELGRLYVSADRFRALLQEDLTELGKLLMLLLTYGLPFAWFGFTLRVSHSNADLSQVGLLRQGAWLMLGLWLVSLLLTRGLRSERRRLWHSTMISPPIYMGVWLQSLVTLPKGDGGDSWSELSLIGMPCVLLFSLWNAWREDQRLRRTLALVGPSWDHIGGRA